MLKARYLFIIFLMASFSDLYSIVVVDAIYSKKGGQLYEWSEIDFSIFFKGEFSTFEVEGIDEKEINDFEIINKSIKTTIDINEDEVKIFTYEINYKLKPIKKGTSSIPNLIALYYTVSNNGSLIRGEEELNKVTYYVSGIWMIVLSVIVFFLVFGILSFIFFIVFYRFKLNRR